MPKHNDEFVYKIQVEGTGVKEYYGLECNHSEDTVETMWLKDVEDRWGAGVRQAFEGDVSVTKLSEEDDTPVLK